MLLNGGFLENLGLYTGEMGLILFFFIYSRYMNNELFSEYSFHLLDKIQNNLHEDTPINYKQGVAGIGCAIEYLVKNEYLKDNTDEILEEFDKRLFNNNNFSCLSIDSVIDIGLYACWRFSGNSLKKTWILQNILHPIVNIIYKWNTKPYLIHPNISILNKIFSYVKISNDQDFLFVPPSRQLLVENSPKHWLLKSTDPLLARITKNNTLDIKKINTGIKDGLTGLGLSMITELYGDDSWVSLFPL